MVDHCDGTTLRVRWWFLCREAPQPGGGRSKNRAKSAALVYVCTPHNPLISLVLISMRLVHRCYAKKHVTFGCPKRILYG
jgi:hypothetical protein